MSEIDKLLESLDYLAGKDLGDTLEPVLVQAGPVAAALREQRAENEKLYAERDAILAENREFRAEIAKLRQRVEAAEGLIEVYDRLQVQDLTLLRRVDEDEGYWTARAAWLAAKGESDG